MVDKIGSLEFTDIEGGEPLGNGWERLKLQCPACGKGELSLRVHFENDEEPADIIIAETKICSSCGIALESSLREQ